MSIVLNTFTFPKRTQYEEERNYFWEKYFQSSLFHRQNWKYIDYQKFHDSNDTIDLIYSSNAKMNVRGSINANIYNIIEVISDKVKMNRKLREIGSAFVPKMFFSFEDERAISEALKKNFFYLKAGAGSISKSTFIVNNYSEIAPIIKKHPQYHDWFLSENIDSYLYKRKGVYQPNGISYNEKYGHKARVKFFILIRIDGDSKEIYMYDQSVFEIAPEEFTGDFTSRSQNIIIGMGSETLHGYPDNYDTDPDYGFSLKAIFGERYFDTIIPQFKDMTADLFKTIQKDLYCKNDKYYNQKFKSCFHFGTVDVIITPDLKCYFLEVNTKPVMDRPSYESIINYPAMIESLVQICIDPFFPPLIKPDSPKGWHKVASVKRTASKTYYVSPTWKFAKEVKQFFKGREEWEEIVYPTFVTNKIDFVGKRKAIEDDLVFTKGKLISKILTLDHYLGNKKNMYDILSSDKRSMKFLPRTLTFTLNDPSWKKRIQRLPSKKHWILKPSVGLRGQDIFISNSKDEIISLILKHTNYTDWVVSEYINNPYLLRIKKNSESGAIYDDKLGRKTHIRIYVMISIINGKYHIFLYDKPLIFAAAKEYNNDISDSYAQLTNLYLGSNYYNKVLNINGALAYQDLSFSLIEVLNQLYGPEFYPTKILPQIKRILRVLLDNSKEYLHCIPSKDKETDCFQNIALDLMPDDKWKIYLLEVNGKPGMNAPSYQWGGTLKDYTDSLLENILTNNLKRIMGLLK